MTTTSETIGKLDTLRRKHGAQSDIGRIISNIIEQLKRMEKETDPAVRERLKVFIADQQERLAKLIAGNRQAGEG